MRRVYTLSCTCLAHPRVSRAIVHAHLRACVCRRYVLWIRLHTYPHARGHPYASRPCTYAGPIRPDGRARARARARPGNLARNCRKEMPEGEKTGSFDGREARPTGNSIRSTRAAGPLPAFKTARKTVAGIRKRDSALGRSVTRTRDSPGESTSSAPGHFHDRYPR